MIKSYIQELLTLSASYAWPVSLVTLIIRDEQCSKLLFYDDFLDSTCISLSISKSLGINPFYAEKLSKYVTLAPQGICMTVFSCLYKVPIIRNILISGGGSGLNLISVYLETSAYIGLLAYNLKKG